MTVRTVSGNVKRITGAARAGSLVRFDLVNNAYTSAEHVPLDDTAAVADSSGNFSLSLFCPATYRCTIDGIQVFDFLLPDSAAPITLEAAHAIGEPPPYTGSTLLGVLGSILASDGSLMPNTVGPVQIAAGAAGAGLVGGGGAALAINTDNSTVEVASDVLQVKNGGVTGAKINAAAIDPVNIVWASNNGRVPPNRSFNGKRRFFPFINASASLVLETTPNAYGTYTLRLITSSPSAIGGKTHYLDEMRVFTGDQIVFKGRLSAASGSAYVFGARCHNVSDGVVAGTTVTATITPDDVAHDYTLAPLTITSDTAYVLTYVQRVSGTGAVSIYDIWGSKGQYAAATPPRAELPSQDGLSGRPGIVFDPMFRSVTPGTDVGGIMSWVVPQDLTPIWGDANNPYGGATIRMADTANKTGGKRFKVGDGGTAIGDIVSFAAVANSASGNLRMNCAFYDATNTLIGSATNGPTIASNGTDQYYYTPPVVIPNTTVFIAAYMQRTSGTGSTDIYALWGGKDGICDSVPMPCPVPQLDRELLPLLSTFGKERMQDWQSQAAKMQLNLSTTQARIVCLGDSWMGHSLITMPLRAALQATWGDAGFGYVDFYNTYTQSTSYREAVTTGAGTARTGTWTDTIHTPTSPTAKGPGFTDIRTSDAAATLSLQTSVACTAIDVWAYGQPGGGTYEYRVDGGSWVPVVTNVAAGLIIEPITGLSNAVHTFEMRVSSVGSQGLIMLGLNLKKNTAGVIVHNLGTNGLTAAEAVAVDATLWQSEIAALSPNVIPIMLMTNDRTGGVVPTVFGASIQTLINRVRAASPLADVILHTAADRLSANTGFTLTSYIAAERDIATRNKNVGFISAHEAIGLHDDADTGRGLWGDAAHLNSIGFRILANQLIRYLAIT